MECKRINDCFECKSDSVKKGWIIKLQRSQNKGSTGEAIKIYDMKVCESEWMRTMLKYKLLVVRSCWVWVIEEYGFWVVFVEHNITVWVGLNVC